MINSRSVEDLSPEMRVLCKAFIAECKRIHDIDVIITSTYRDAESQNALYAQGRTTPGKKVTNVKGWDSYHQWKIAFDFAPLKFGKIDWNDTELFTKCGEIAESLGMEWGGRFKTLKDYPHVQMAGQSIAELKKKAGL